LARQGKEKLWREGNLRWRLDATQQVIYDRIKGAAKRRYFLNCSRRLGKSFVLLAIAAEFCIKNRDSRVLYVAPTAKDAAKIATDNWITLSRECPKDIRPDYKAQSKELIFPNGSVIRFGATNGDHAEDLRGGQADLVILDEAGTMDNFANVLYSIVEPMTASTGEKARGAVYIATTPSETTGHDSMKVYEEYARRGLLSEFTLNDNPRIPYDEKVEMLATYGEPEELIPEILAGKAPPVTTRSQREYYCQWVTDSKRAVVPEYTAEARTEILQAVAPPPFRDCFVAMDPGMVDNTGILFGYWDFIAQRLVIEDEWVAPHAGTPKIAAAITGKEQALWTGRNEVFRVSDTELRLIRDLQDQFQLQFAPAQKKDSLGAVQLMRRWVQTRQILIHPRCVNLDRQLKNAIWNRRAKDFERDESEEGIDGHYDLVAALKYMVRYVNTQRQRNPYPDGWLAPGFNEYLPLKHPSRQAKPKSLFDDTPLGRRLAKASKRRPGGGRF
jgi:hypothetical protein